MRPPHDRPNARSATLPQCDVHWKVALRASGDSRGGRVTYFAAAPSFFPSNSCQNSYTGASAFCKRGVAAIGACAGMRSHCTAPEGALISRCHEPIHCHPACFRRGDAPRPNRRLSRDDRRPEVGIDEPDVSRGHRHEGGAASRAASRLERRRTRSRRPPRPASCRYLSLTLNSAMRFAAKERKERKGTELNWKPECSGTHP